ncbi:MAG TPA: winged helix DNA-binding domain-containing protein [Pseudonocardia sp.]
MVARRIDAAERRARLAVRHRHVVEERTDDVLALTDGLVALHSTDPVSVYLSAAARMVNPSLTPLDQALYEDRSLVRHHAMRRTLWVFGHETARLAHHAATVGVAKVQRRNTLAMLAAGGIAEPEKWLAAASDDIVALLSETGPQPARVIGERLPQVAVLVPVGTGKFASTQSAHSRVLLLMGFEGRVMRARPTGTWINGQYRWAATPTWFPDGFGALDARAAAAGLARRWLAAFGPGTRADLAWWAGWTVAVTERALADVGAVEVVVDEGTGFVLPDDVDPPLPAPPSAVLLPGLDPSTMGWKQRSFHLADADVPLLFDRNGNGGPTAWVDGRIVGAWHRRADGEIALHLTADVGAEARAALETEADALTKLLGEVRFSTRFPAPVQAILGQA